MSNYSKGKKAEKEFCEFLDGEGFEHWKPAWFRFGSKDIFNAFDIIAIKKMKAFILSDFRKWARDTILVQVKSSKSQYSKGKKQIGEFYDRIGWSTSTFPIDTILAMKEKEGWICWHPVRGEVFFKKVEVRI